VKPTPTGERDKEGKTEKIREKKGRGEERK